VVCKGICIRHRAKNTGGKYLRYINGQVRCNLCEIFLTPEGVKNKPHGKYCKCCGNKIRSKPRCNSCKKAYEELPTITNWVRNLVLAFTKKLLFGGSRKPNHYRIDFEKQRRQQRNVCSMCGWQPLIPIAKGRLICTQCNTVKVLYWSGNWFILINYLEYDDGCSYLQMYSRA